MGAGLIPCSIKNGKLYFLFGRENKYDDGYPNYWADFGGGTDNKETFLETAVREGTEELTGFLGSFDQIKNMLKKGTFNIDNTTKGFGTFRTHIFPLDYDEKLPYYYNNNQQFLQKKLDQSLIKKSKIFEKSEIKWFSVDELVKRKKDFKKWYQEIINKIINSKNDIYKFIKQKQLKNTNTRRTKTRHTNNNSNNSNNKTRSKR